MEWMNLNIIPTWVVGIIMLYTGWIWLATRKTQIRMDSTIIAYTLLAWGSLYVLSAFSSDRLSEDYLLFRVVMSRAVIIFICLAQAIPMSISYWRSKVRGGFPNGG